MSRSYSLGTALVSGTAEFRSILKFVWPLGPFHILSVPIWISSSSPAPSSFDHAFHKAFGSRTMYIFPAFASAFGLKNSRSPGPSPSSYRSSSSMGRGETPSSCLIGMSVMFASPQGLQSQFQIRFWDDVRKVCCFESLEPRGSATWSGSQGDLWCLVLVGWNV